MPKRSSLSHTAARTARGTIAADAVAAHDAPELMRRVLRTLARAVPFDAAGFCPTDPDTMLWTGGVVTGLPAESVPAFFEAELLAGDALSFRELLGCGRVVGTLAEATGGELERSVRFRRLYAPHGIGAELRVAFVADGRCWGTACLLREQGAGDFSRNEAAFVADAARDVAGGLRAAVARHSAAAHAGDPSAPGVLVVDDEVRPLSHTDAAARWLDELMVADPTAESGMPSVVYSVVGRAKRAAAGEPGPLPRARLRTAAGRWLTVQATALSGDERAWAVTLESTRPSEVLALIAEGHDLTAREQQVLGLLLRGVPDRGIAQELVVSAHTAREHSGRVLQKFGARSRGELQALLFERHYDPWSEVVAPSPRK